MVPIINSRVKECQDLLNDVPHNQMDANLEKTVEKILEISTKVQEIVKETLKINEYQTALEQENT